MTGNSNDRKKALVVFMLLFLVSGGGVFLFFVVQGSNDLIGKGKEFSYGGAAREGVSSFFKYVGLSTAEEKPLSRAARIRMEAKGLVIGEPPPGNVDVSDWMEKPSGRSASASRAAVPKMGGGGLSGAGGIGGGGSRSSGGVSRFGGGGGLGNAVSKGGPGKTDTTEKGTLGALNRAKNSLGEGLRSGSAMTAKSKWGSGFGEGSGKGGQLAYGSGGMVKLDTIKKGEVSNLKMGYGAKPSVPDATEFQRDGKAESKDSVLQDAKKAAAEEASKAAKQAIAQQLAQAAANSPAGTASGGPSNAAGGSGGDQAQTLELPNDVQSGLNNSICTNSQCVTPNGVVNDATATVLKDGDNYKIIFKGTVTPPGGTPIPNEEVWGMDSKGNLMGLIRSNP